MLTLLICIKYQTLIITLPINDRLHHSSLIALISFLKLRLFTQNLREYRAKVSTELTD